MSRPLSRFMFVSLIGLFVVLTALVHFYRQINQHNLEHHFHAHNLIMAVLLRNSLLGEGLWVLLNHEASAADKAAVLGSLEGALRIHLKRLPVVKVKIYDTQGMTVYSTDWSQIGEDASNNPGVQTALRGREEASIVYRDRMNTFDGVKEDLDVHQQYIPIRDPEREIVEGVFEIYSDISPLLSRVTNQEKLVFAVVTAILSSFFFVLYVMFRQTDQALRKEQRQREDHLHELEMIREDLERRVAERTKEIDTSRTFLQSVIDGIGNPLLVIRPDLTVSLMNRAARDLLPEHLKGPVPRRCYEISHRRDTPCAGEDHPCSFAQVIQHGRAARVRHTHFDANGQPMIVDVVSTPLYDEQGDLQGIIEVEHDVTQIVRMQAGLVESETRLQAIMDNVPDAILTLDQEGVVETANRAAVELLALGEESMIGRSLAAWILDAETAQRLIGRSGSASRSAVSAEVTIQRHDGHQSPADVWVGEMNPAGERKYIAVLRDITQRKKAREELEKTRQQYFHQEKMAAIGHLAAGILHEVGNPISAIAGAAAELQGVSACGKPDEHTCSLDDAVSQNIRLISQQTARLAKITREIADFASPRPRERELLDLNSLLQSTARLLTYDRRFRNVQLSLELDRDLPAIVGVADQLTQVFMNLLINAMDACTAVPESQSRISIVSAREGDQVRVEVRDNGIGMTGDTLARSTEPFFTTKAVGKGTGLGLSLCDTIARSHGGVLKIDSTPEVGTSVCVELPIDCDATFAEQPDLVQQGGAL